MSRYIIVTLVALFISGTASAWGEIFPLKMRGTAYCDDGFRGRLNAKTAPELWIRLDNGGQWTVSFSPDFPDDWELTFPLFIDAVGTAFANKRNAFSGGTLFEDGYIIVTGELKYERNKPYWKSVKATFSEFQVFGLGCWSHGKVRTGRITNR